MPRPTLNDLEQEVLGHGGFFSVSGVTTARAGLTLWADAPDGHVWSATGSRTICQWQGFYNQASYEAREEMMILVRDGVEPGLTEEERAEQSDMVETMRLEVLEATGV